MIRSSENTPIQLTLDLPHEPLMGREDFLISESNEKALKIVESWPNWPANFVILYGPKGSGKTHLVEIWRKLSDAQIFDVSDLSRLDVVEAVVEGPVVIEDINDGTEFNQEALFHLMNAILAENGSLIITTNELPATWDISIPDLKSRIRLAIVAELSIPSDNLLRQVLMKLFADRQLDVKENVIEYMAMHMERSLQFAQELVREVDSYSLRESRRITKQVVSKVLNEMASELN